MAFNEQNGLAFLSVLEAMASDSQNNVKLFVNGKFSEFDTNIKTYIDGKTELNAEELAATKEIVTILFNAVDEADGDPDAQITLKATLQQMMAKAGLNEAAINTANTAISSLETALKAEIMTINQAATNLRTEFEKVRQAFNSYIDEVNAKISDLQLNVVGLSAFVGALVTGAPEMQDRAKASSRAIFGLQVETE